MVKPELEEKNISRIKSEIYHDSYLRAKGHPGIRPNPLKTTHVRPKKTRPCDLCLQSTNDIDNHLQNECPVTRDLLEEGDLNDPDFAIMDKIIDEVINIPDNYYDIELEELKQTPDKQSSINNSKKQTPDKIKNKSDVKTKTPTRQFI